VVKGRVGLTLVEDHCGSSESQHDESFVESTMKVSSHDKTLMGDTVRTICVRDKLVVFLWGGVAISGWCCYSCRLRRALTALGRLY
jgi:hypothetical protein